MRKLARDNKRRSAFPPFPLSQHFEKVFKVSGPPLKAKDTPERMGEPHLSDYVVLDPSPLTLSPSAS